MPKPHSPGAGASSNGPRERPSLRAQADAHRASKGSHATRAADLNERAATRYEAARRAHFAAHDRPTPPAEHAAILRRVDRTHDRLRATGRHVRRAFRMAKPGR